jgi:hypothetical protein
MEFDHTIDLENRIISVAVSVFSILGCSFIILSLSTTKIPRYSHLYYVFWLAVADALTGFFQFFVFAYNFKQSLFL